MMKSNGSFWQNFRYILTVIVPLTQACQLPANKKQQNFTTESQKQEAHQGDVQLQLANSHDFLSKFDQGFIGANDNLTKTLQQPKLAQQLDFALQSYAEHLASLRSVGESEQMLAQLRRPACISQRINFDQEDKLELLAALFPVAVLRGLDPAMVGRLPSSLQASHQALSQATWLNEILLNAESTYEKTEDGYKMASTSEWKIKATQANFRMNMKRTFESQSTQSFEVKVSLVFANLAPGACHLGASFSTGRHRSGTTLFQYDSEKTVGCGIPGQPGFKAAYLHVVSMNRHDSSKNPFLLWVDDHIFVDGQAKPDWNYPIQVAEDGSCQVKALDNAKNLAKNPLDNQSHAPLDSESQSELATSPIKKPQPRHSPIVEESSTQSDSE